RAESPDFLIRVPDYWSKYKIDGAYLPTGGCASYQLMLRGLEVSRPVTIYIPDFGSAYRVFIDGALTAESGVVSRNAHQVFTTTGVKLYPVTLSDAPEHVVVIEVATARFSGLYMAPVLKEYDHAIQDESNRNTARRILFGMALFSFFVLIVMYGLSFREGKRSFWLPFIGLLVLLRIMLTTEFYSLWQNTMFCGLSYEAANPLLFLITFAFKYLLIYLIEGLLRIGFSQKEKLFFLAFYTALFFAYLFVPNDFYNRYLTIALPAAAFAIEIYFFFKIWINRQRLNKYGLLIYWGGILAITGLILDCYYINGNSYLNLSLALLTLFSAYMMILSLVAALQAADVHRELALSASRLALVKKQIAMQADYYNTLSEQINEVRAVRHDMRHFVGVMTQLSGEGRYGELDRFLSDYADKSETEPLPVFCDNIVANSILGYYSLKAKERDITFFCACAIPKRLSVSDGDLCVGLSNALENALEACGKLAEPEARLISAEARISGGQLLIKIENSYDGHLNQRDTQYLSTKSGQDHGLGLRNIQKVVDTYRGFLKTEHNGTKFTLMAAFSLSGEMQPDTPTI
ncbi:MAG: GHKL domain-containing protein, partial [Lawsonibacter sp.]|nr:GHKL domain-containing protein [Lawsonibacter sp.]